MRNGQNKRMRGRNNRNHSHNNNNKGHHQNPLTRVYESNGPDVKIRGNAHHIAEKYMQLARDASSSGDPVTAENFYQHAEHYLRLIAAAQEQFRQQNPYYQAPPAPGSDAANDIAFDDEDDQSGQQQPQPNMAQQPQPYPAREPQPQYGQQQPRQQHQQPHHQPQPQPQFQPQPGYEGNNGLPSFITGNQPAPSGDTDNNHEPREAGQPGGDRFPRRRRRHPRGPRPEMAGGPPDDQRPAGE
jgi:type II secretory pathway pseudopilin PulG